MMDERNQLTKENSTNSPQQEGLDLTSSSQLDEENLFMDTDTHTLSKNDTQTSNLSAAEVSFQAASDPFPDVLHSSSTKKKKLLYGC